MIEKKILKDVPINTIIPYENNPRSNDLAVKEVAESIREFGYIKIGIIVDEAMILLAGHTTLKAMKFLGWDKVPEVTQVIGLSEAQKIAYRIADNKTAEVAKWDFDKLEAEVKKLTEMEYKLDFTGFSEEQLKKMFEIFPEPKKETEMPKAKEGSGQIYYQDETGVLYCGNALSVLQGLDDESVDLIATDPPYGLEFMGKEWDKAVPDVAIWKEAFRVLKAGAFAFIMSSPRQDVLLRMIQNLEAAGFDCGFTSLYWAYASGIPKTVNVAKAVDKRLGFDGRFIEMRTSGVTKSFSGEGVWRGGSEDYPYMEPITYAAKKAAGSYTGYNPKPAVEVILVAMKPLSEGSYVNQAEVDGKGVTHLDDVRIPLVDDSDKYIKRTKTGEKIESCVGVWESGEMERQFNCNDEGRFPANLIVSDNVLDDGIEHKSSKIKTIGGFGVAKNTFAVDKLENEDGTPKGIVTYERGYNDSGGFSRFFSLDAWWEKRIDKLPERIRNTIPFLIVKKPSKRERDIGCEDVEPRSWDEDYENVDKPQCRGKTKRKNYHPTVKPIKLFSYMIIMGSREGDVVLDIYMGSGTCGMAAKINNRKWIGIELLEDYAEIAKNRISAIKSDKDLGGD